MNCIELKIMYWLVANISDKQFSNVHTTPSLCCVGRAGIAHICALTLRLQNSLYLHRTLSKHIPFAIFLFVLIFAVFRSLFLHLVLLHYRFCTHFFLFDFVAVLGLFSAAVCLVVCASFIFYNKYYRSAIHSGEMATQNVNTYQSNKSNHKSQERDLTKTEKEHLFAHTQTHSRLIGLPHTSSSSSWTPFEANCRT